MKQVRFDVDSEEMQEMLKEVAETSQHALIMSKLYKDDVSHVMNDVVYMTVMKGYCTAMKFIATILEKDDVSFEDLIKEIDEK